MTTMASLLSFSSFLIHFLVSAFLIGSDLKKIVPKIVLIHTLSRFKDNHENVHSTELKPTVDSCAVD